MERIPYLVSSRTDAFDEVDDILEEVPPFAAADTPALVPYTDLAFFAESLAAAASELLLPSGSDLRVVLDLALPCCCCCLGDMLTCTAFAAPTALSRPPMEEDETLRSLASLHSISSV